MALVGAARSRSASSTICGGLTVIEMGSGSIAASIAGMILADNGARVVKVEPSGGDRLRAELPSGFLVWNRGKESLVADLSTPEGRLELAAWMAHADIAISGFAPGVAERWGLGPERLCEQFPRLIHCSITGFGRHPGFAGLKAYEAIVGAKAGLFGLGDFGFRPGPIFSGAPFASSAAAHLAVAGILAALIARLDSGLGQCVETSLLQGLGPMDYFGTMLWQLNQRHATDASLAAQAAGKGATRFSILACSRDGRWAVLNPSMAHHARALMEVMGLQALLDDPRFLKAAVFDNPADAQAWEDEVLRRFRSRPLGEWVELFDSHPDVPFEIVRSSEEGLDHPQIVHNGDVIVVDDPVHGRVREVGPVAAFELTPSSIAASAPPLGSHGEPFAPTGDARWSGAPSGAAARLPLEGVTIIECGYFYAMPFGVTMAATLGARVIKLEDRRGDPMRFHTPVPEASGAKATEGKESVALDLKSPAALRIVRRLVEQADAFVLGFRPGVAERLGLDRHSLRAVNPELIYLHAAGYGIDGPYAGRPLFANPASMVVGSFRRQAGAWLDPAVAEGMSVEELQAVVTPRLRGPVSGDSSAAAAVFSTLLLALAHKRRTGQGQFISSSMIGANAYSFSDDFVAYAGKQPVPMPDGEQLGLHALYRLYRAGDGWVFLAAGTEREWAAFTAVVAPELACEPAFDTAEGRTRNDDALAQRLTGLFAGAPANHWEDVLTPAGVACVAVFEGSLSDFTCTDPGLRAAGLVADVVHPVFGPVLRHGLPVTLSGGEGRVAPGCTTGQHTEAILSELGYSQSEIAALEAEGVIRRGNVATVV